MTELFANTNTLRYNPHGGAIVRQSDLSSWSRCQLQKFYYAQADADPTAPQPANLSATVYGTVVHYTLMLMEQLHHEDPSNPDILATCQATFTRYWDPKNITQLPGAGLVDEWLPRQTYAGLRARGLIALKDYYDLLRKDQGKLLALEYRFAVPLEVGGRVHTLTGTIDRLAVQKHYTKPYLSIEDFKGLALDTPLPTPDGWTTMGAVQVGDRLFGADGKPCSVVEKSSVFYRDCYRVTFDDGSSLVADAVHLWQVETGHPRHTTTEVLDTAALAQRLNGRSGQRDLRILNCAPWVLPDRPGLPVDPYTFGAWLGDGHHDRAEITKPDLALFEEIARRGYGLGKERIDPGTGCRTFTILGLARPLREAGLRGVKHIPEYYLRAGYRQRLDLLRGLMDTDGSWHKTRRRAVFTSTDKALAASVHELVGTLGWKATTFEVQRSGYGQTVTAYDVCFTPVDANPFLLPRKADLVDTLDSSPSHQARRRLVVSVDPVPTVPTQCIQVDAPDSLYLAGEQMVPTHNTGKQPTYLRHNMQGTAYAYATTCPEFWSGWEESGVDVDMTFSPKVIQSLERSFGSYGYDLLAGGDRKLASRRFRWINIQEIKIADGGWRTDRDYTRLKMAVDAYVRANEAGAYSVTTTGEVCRWCSFRTTCGGTGIADDRDGAP